MPLPPQLIFTVTNDLSFDQRMQRICGSLAAAGYHVTLVGRLLPHSRQLAAEAWQQVRLPVAATSGKQFYWQYNKALYKWLMQQLAGTDASRTAICAIDLDTIVPVYMASRRTGALRMYDAHELFTELTEVKRRPLVHRAWRLVERLMVPRFERGYTVNTFIAGELQRRYGVRYAVVRNMPMPAAGAAADDEEPPELPPLPDRFLLYQGAVNEGRAFDKLIPAMRKVALPLVIAGDGNYMQQLRQLIQAHQLQHKVIMLGMQPPTLLRHITRRARAGITLFDNSGLNQYYSLANRFFDYVQAGIPQLCNDYPEYRLLCKQFEVALLLQQLDQQHIAAALNKLCLDDVLYRQLQQEATAAAQVWHWKQEEKQLLDCWQNWLPI
ncbi:MAG: glycosyltransferase [Chitinophagaceae bacterium]|nr:glycosyltransferase [Chitinophagaceae bacterium]